MQTKGMPEGNEATNPQTRKGHHSQPKREKAKGISQMIAGAAVAVIGVPLCVLPGPGAGEQGAAHLFRPEADQGGAQA